jgi:hypothetical protein
VDRVVIVYQGWLVAQCTLAEVTAGRGLEDAYAWLTSQIPQSPR